MPKSYNCSKCPGYCCSYHIIPVTRRDLQRLADHFGISFTKAKAKFVTKGREEDKKDGEFQMRRKADTHFGKICRFFDTEKRCCTIYKARRTSAGRIPSAAAATTTSWPTSAARRKTPSWSPPPGTSDFRRSRNLSEKPLRTFPIALLAPLDHVIERTMALAEARSIGDRRLDVFAAPATETDNGSPCASPQAIAVASVQPVPCVWRVLSRGKA